MASACESYGPQCSGSTGVRIMLPEEDAAMQECEKLLNGIEDSPAAFIWL